jgi:hypothetical protein
MLFLSPYVAHSAFKHAQVARSSDSVGVRRCPRRWDVVSDEPPHGAASDGYADSQRHVEGGVNGLFTTSAVDISFISKELFPLIKSEI